MKFRTALGALSALASFAAAAAPAAAQPYTVTQNLHFTVHVGPTRSQTCDVIGDLYRPADATAAHPDPAILTTNGFGGSKDDQADTAKVLAADGYVVLSYSGLGFGGSGCAIELDSPDWDGAAASQLITFLGGGSAATDGTKVDYVIHDAVAHDGTHRANDPRVGMIGGSYGGQIQFATADVDPRLDTIIPIITWNDLSYSLDPNNTGFFTGVSAQTPGVTKFEWVNLFSALGQVDGVQGASVDPTRELTGCPNFDQRVCAPLVEMDALGYPNDTAVAVLREASVASYMHNIRIPTMLMQGEDDTLFNLHEAAATYQALKAQHTPVKMVWQTWGHSDGTPAPGEWAQGNGILNKDGSTTTEGRLVMEWFNHYLKSNPIAPALDFTFFRPWVTYTSTTSADDAYASASSYPLGTTRSLYLSGADALESSASSVTAGTASFTTPPAGAPSSTTEISAVSQSVPLTDAPGTYAKFVSAPLSGDTDVVGVPSVRLRITAPLSNLTGAADASGELALFFKLEDIAPDGTATLPDRLISPARFATLDDPVTVTLPGIAHRFAAGHRIALIITGGDAAYRSGLPASPVSITSDPADPGVLSIPVAGAGSYGPIAYGAVPRQARHTRGHRTGARIRHT